MLFVVYLYLAGLVVGELFATLPAAALIRHGLMARNRSVYARAIHNIILPPDVFVRKKNCSTTHKGTASIVLCFLYVSICPKLSFIGPMALYRLENALEFIIYHT